MEADAIIGACTTRRSRQRATEAIHTLITIITLYIFTTANVAATNGHTDALSVVQGDTDEARRAGPRKRGITLLIAETTIAVPVDKSGAFTINVTGDRNALATYALISRCTLKVIGACTTADTAAARKFTTRQTDVKPVYIGTDEARRASGLGVGYIVTGWEAVPTDALKVTK